MLSRHFHQKTSSIGFIKHSCNITPFSCSIISTFSSIRSYGTSSSSFSFTQKMLCQTSNTNVSKQQKQQEQEQQQQQQKDDDEVDYYELTDKTKETLTRLLYHEHYRPNRNEKELGNAKEKRYKIDPSSVGWYDAKTELGWICEWANELIEFPQKGMPEIKDELSFQRAVEFAVLERVDLNKPLSLILGTQPFCGVDILCRQPLLQPRTETEEWVHFLLTHWMKRAFIPTKITMPPPKIPLFGKQQAATSNDPSSSVFRQLSSCYYSPNPEDDPSRIPPGGRRFRVLDLCSGTGCIGAALLKHFPHRVEVVGVDSESVACETTWINYRTAHVMGKRALIRARNLGLEDEAEIQVREIEEKELDEKLQQEDEEKRKKQQAEAGEAEGIEGAGGGDDEYKDAQMEAERMERKIHAGEVLSPEAEKLRQLELLEQEAQERKEKREKAKKEILKKIIAEKDQEIYYQLNENNNNNNQESNDNVKTSSGGGGGDDDGAGTAFSVFRSDMFKDLPKEFEGYFDLILCNPPYILEEEFPTLPISVRNFEDKICLVGDERHKQNPLSYFKELRDESPKYLASSPMSPYVGPRLIFELGLQYTIVEQLFKENPKWKQVVLFNDVANNPRWVECML